MLRTRLEDILQSKIIRFETVSGGCVANAQKISTADRNDYFLKTGGTFGMFTKEANGLKEIASSNTLAVPNIIAVDDDFLLLFYIKTGARSSEFFKDFGREYANMHRCSASQYGFYEDNFLGNTSQINIPDSTESNNWPLFYFNKRLKYQFLIAESRGYVTSELRQFSLN